MEDEWEEWNRKPIEEKRKESRKVLDRLAKQERRRERDL